MQFRGQRSRLQRMQFIGPRKRNLHPNDLLDLDQVLAHVICQRWHIAAVFANHRIIAPCQISQDRRCADAYDKVSLLWFRRGPRCPFYLYLNEVVHLILRRRLRAGRFEFEKNGEHLAGSDDATLTGAAMDVRGETSPLGAMPQPHVPPAALNLSTMISQYFRTPRSLTNELPL